MSSRLALAVLVVVVATLVVGLTEARTDRHFGHHWGGSYGYPQSTISAYGQNYVAYYNVTPDAFTATPTGHLNVRYPSLKVNYGNTLVYLQAATQPIVTWKADRMAYYSLLWVDLDAATQDQMGTEPFTQWLVVNVPGSNLAAGQVKNPYAQPADPRDTRFHRYTFILYKQQGTTPTNFDAIPGGPASMPYACASYRVNFRPQTFQATYNLTPVAVNFFRAQYDGSFSVNFGQFPQGPPTCQV